MLPYPASSFSPLVENANPAREFFKASFGRDGDRVGAPDGNRLDIRVLDDGVGLPGGLDARELRRRRLP